MSESIDWEKEDAKYIWHPAMQMKDNEVFPPVVIDHAKGVYLYDMERNIWTSFLPGGAICWAMRIRKSMKH